MRRFYSDVQFLIQDRTTRERTPEGMLRASAVITRTGPFSYDSAELGLGSPGKEIIVERTADTLRHPDTLNSLRAAPMTIGHPEENVGPDTWRRETVGSVAGEPYLDSEGFLRADVLAGDRAAINAIENGTVQLSVGYTFDIQPIDNPTAGGATYRTTGPLVVNHVALVERGRAGPEARILDEGRTMDQATINAIGDAVKSAVRELIPAQDRGNGGTNALDADKLAERITGGLATALKPTMDAVAKLTDAQAKAEDDRKAKEAADAFEASIVTRERGRFDVLRDAAHFIPAEELSQLSSAPVKDILVKALTSTLPNAAQMDEAFLRGALSMAVAQKGTGGAPGVPNPNGVGAAPPIVGGDAVTQARDAYIAGQAKQHERARYSEDTSNTMSA